MRTRKSLCRARSILPSLLVSGMLLAVLPCVHAQSSPSFTLLRGVVAQGAGRSSGASFNAHSVIGQPMIDAAAGASFVVHSGFGCVLCDTSAVVISVEQLPTPLDMRIAAMYPNPARDMLHIDLRIERPTHLRVTLHDVFGSMVLPVHDAPMREGRWNVPIRLPVLPPGTYMLRIQSGNRVQTRMLTILR
jgi:hypothetical protein